jgi:hypothetical protein
LGWASVISIEGKFFLRRTAASMPCTRQAPRREFTCCTVPQAVGAPRLLISVRTKPSAARSPSSRQKRGLSIPAAAIVLPEGIAFRAQSTASVAPEATPI